MNGFWKLSSLALLLTLLGGCATRTVVVPKASHSHAVTTKHVVYHTRPAKRSCWRHRGHWDCR